LHASTAYTRNKKENLTHAILAANKQNGHLLTLVVFICQQTTLALQALMLNTNQNISTQTLTSHRGILHLHATSIAFIGYKSVLFY